MALSNLPVNRFYVYLWRAMKRLAIKHAEHKQNDEEKQKQNSVETNIYIPQSDTVFVNSF